MVETIFDIYTEKEIEEKLSEISKLVSNGFKDEEIVKKFDFKMIDELISIARARIKASRELGKYIGDIEYFNLDDFRFSTPKGVAYYRARRLKCKKIVDLCSGIGIQSGAFAKNCNEVYSFEIDERKVKYSQENFKHIQNIKFFVGNVLEPSVIEKVRQICPDVIFCDPERLAEEKERNLDSINPNIKKLISVYSKICKNICLEVPPQIEINKLNELGDSEKEYLSVNNKLNRLDLYFGTLRKDSVSVIDVATTMRVVNNNNNNKKSRTIRNPLNYIYEISGAIIKAGLINELASLVCADILEGTEKNKVLLTSKNLSLEFSSLAKPYGVIDICKNDLDINKALRRKGFGKVVIKYSIDPKDYWKERNQLEKNLQGNKGAVVFKVNRNYLICEEYD
jgi:16S rRNA G966 N2-methylase RsmD